MKYLLFTLAVVLSGTGAARAQFNNVYAVTEKWKVVVNGVTNSGSTTGVIKVNLGSFTLIDKIGFAHSGGARHGYIHADGSLDSHSLVYGIGATAAGQWALMDLNFTTMAVNIGSEAGTSISPNTFTNSGTIFLGIGGSGLAVMPLIRRSINISITSTSTVAPYVDTKRPTVAITSPKVRQRTTNNTFTVTGKANDEIAVTNVFYKFNDGDWTPAETTNDWAHWSVPALTLIPKTNVISAYAVDSAGNLSITNTVKFYYVFNGQPTVQVVGPGTVAPNYNGRNLEVGKTFSMTATELKGGRFVDWTGDIISTNRKLNFTMTVGANFTANFVDVARPVNAITSPKANRLVTNAVFTATGKASDNVGVDAVWCQLNGTGWNLVTSSNVFKNWTAPGLTPVAGTNLIESFAVDAAGNISLTNKIKFKH